jgi:glycosyltransferase involved in cell wall biosynthesis
MAALEHVRRVRACGPAPVAVSAVKIFDTRWKGRHGIGRFATEVHARLSGFTPIAIGGRPSSPLDPLVCSRYLRSVAPELYFSPGYSPPLDSPCPFVFCIHDLIHLHVPDSSSPFKRAWYRCIVRPAVHRAAAVLTVSEFSHARICEWARVPDDKVINVGNGISSAFTPSGPAHGCHERPYFLHVGAHRSHKNLPRTLRAFAESHLAGPYRLICTGTPSAEVLETIDRHRLAAHICFLPAPDDETLAALYRGAVALVFPSLYEGFGLPVVEAMACGTPVIASAVASIPEIAGDAALLVDPHEVAEIADAFRRLAGSESLREALRRRGLERATRYSWDDTAARINAVLACASH